MTHSKIDSFKKAWAAVSTQLIDQKDKGQPKDKGKKDTKRKKGAQEEGEEDEQEGKNKKGKGQGKGGKGKAKTVEDILLSKAAKVKAKYLSVYGQCTAFVGAAKSDPQFDWISDENMAPIYKAQELLAKDTLIHIGYIYMIYVYTCYILNVKGYLLYVLHVKSYIYNYSIGQLVYIYVVYKCFI